MVYKGKVYKEKEGLWISIVDEFHAMTQGPSKDDALYMIVDWFECVSDLKGFANIHSVSGEDFEINLKEIPKLLKEYKQSHDEKTLSIRF